MSNPVTNAEVEDVLSSIRRLVSEEKRPVATTNAVPQNDRLVLTPALRIETDAPVGDDWNTDDTVDADQNDAPDPQESAPPNDVFKLENPQNDVFDPAADDEQKESVGQWQDVAEDDYATDPYNFDDEEDVDGESDAVLTLNQRDRSDSQWAETALEQLEESDSFDELPETVAAPGTKAATLSAKIEALESAIGGIEDEFEPDEAGTDAYSGTEAPAMAWEDDLKQDEDLEDDLTPQQPSRATQVDDAIPEYEDKDTSQDPHDDSAGQDTEEEMEHRIEEAVFAATSRQAQQDDEPFAFASDNQYIDEEALRDMVGDIVRAELQGALGERITRNVRKLVRREIHRALTTQDLE